MISEIYNSFRPQKLEGFVSLTTADTLSPVATIADVVNKRLSDRSLFQWLDGYDDESLCLLKHLSSVVNVEFLITYKQGRDLSEIGAQILALDDDFKIVPPLELDERHSIRRLVEVVESTSAILSHRQ